MVKIGAAVYKTNGEMDRQLYGRQEKNLSHILSFFNIYTKNLNTKEKLTANALVFFFLLTGLGVVDEIYSVIKKRCGLRI